MPRLLRTYISATKDKPLSPNIVYDASYTEGNEPGAKTTLTMHQLGEKGGNCYILQLKNGHFIVCDGGDVGDYEGMVAYMESLVPEGEKPHIEAWFMSHDHGDHLGFLWDIGGVVTASRVTVEGFYYIKLSNDVHKMLGTNNVIPLVERALQFFCTADNKQTPVYRCHAGDRYYFNDISVEVVYTNEQILEEEYTGNYNSSCTWLMFNIEGQKFLNAGDAEIVNMRHVDAMMEESYMDVDMMNVHHHGVNIYLDNLNYYNCETLLYSGWCTYTVYYPQEIRDGMLKMQDEYCEEYMSYVNGSIVMTFPYTVGSYEVLPTRRQDLTDHYRQRSIEWMQAIGRSDMPR
jgi:L-ascorbate metabolism protein UlaG (beta-lactamase superfamily)